MKWIFYVDLFKSQRKGERGAVVPVPVVNPVTVFMKAGCKCPLVEESASTKLIVGSHAHLVIKIFVFTKTWGGFKNKVR